MYKLPSFSVDFVDWKQNKMVCFGGSVLVSQLESTWSLCLYSASWPSAGVRIQRLSSIVSTVQRLESLWYRTALEYNTYISHKIFNSCQSNIRRCLVPIFTHLIKNGVNLSYLCSIHVCSWSPVALRKEWWTLTVQVAAAAAAVVV